MKLDNMAEILLSFHLGVKGAAHKVEAQKRPP
jgi:hypothetical protein